MFHTESITLNGQHYGVEVQGLVFDNLSVTGITREDWLNDFQSISRPALYLGKRSIFSLQAFLDGYTFACRQLAIPVTEQEQEFTEFQDWIEKQFNQHSTRSWARIILFYSEDESQALDTFFQLFENFLQRESSLDADTISRHQQPRKW
ncbi:papain fold toxin domain-containing protein [Microcoleus sp. ARI1-B5]|uniref:papain fold toxin domain-containing protein n=1 Tax=unclassified Microcoleus TaxID=2642155 RepID=UPI002FD3D1BE